MQNFWQEIFVMILSLPLVVFSQRGKILIQPLHLLSIYVNFQHIFFVRLPSVLYETSLSHIDILFWWFFFSLGRSHLSSCCPLQSWTNWVKITIVVVICVILFAIFFINYFLRLLCNILTKDLVICFSVLHHKWVPTLF